MGRYAQVVVGPPGAGKTTYCKGMGEFMASAGRDVAIVNLDPANERPPYDVAIDLADLVCLEDVMEKLDLGPNGGLVYCMEYLESNLDWLIERLGALENKYVVFDFPGQVELFTHHQSVQRLLTALQQRLDFRICVVHLVDAHHCSDASKFVSAVLLSLMTMLKLEMPHVNVLSKVDLVEMYGPLPFNLDYFTDVLDLRRLLMYLDNKPDTSYANETGEGDDVGGDGEAEVGAEEAEERAGAGDAAGVGGADEGNIPRRRRLFHRMNEKICDLIEDFQMVSFTTLNIQEPESVARLLASVDKANGFVFGGLDSDAAADAMFRSVVGDDLTDLEKTMAAAEQYTSAFGNAV